MSVAENVALVPTLLKWQKARIEERVVELLDMVGLPYEEFSKRMPEQLSGGQRQRIGLARALAGAPEILLMDEPFGALDPITREEMQNEFLSLQETLKKTVLFVTHDIFEAVKVADRIVVMRDGRIEQVAEPAKLVAEPANEFVEGFLGQHRFQLSLLTVRLGDVFPLNQKTAAVGPPPAGTELRCDLTLLEALDKFKSQRIRSLPVVSKNKKSWFMLEREALINKINLLLGEGATQQKGDEK